jgi:Tc toxin complex TcA C-terminal TcB-binding domain/PA14 domain
MLDTKNALSPKAYYIDLLEYTLKHVKRTFWVNGLRGEYYNNKDFTNLILIRTDTTVDFNWENNSPVPEALVADEFSVRWTGKIKSDVSGMHTFTVASDDGVRLRVDGKLLIDRWEDHALQSYSTTINLNKNEPVDIQLEYYENRGNATVKLYWTCPGQEKCIIPATQLISLPVSNQGLKGEYFKDKELKELVFTRLDSQVAFKWGTGTPAPGIPSDDFSVRWTGILKPVNSGKFRFMILSDDGVRLWIDGNLIIDNWTEHPETEDVCDIFMIAGKAYNLRLEYYERGYDSTVKLLWKHEKQAEPELVAASQLSSVDIGMMYLETYFQQPLHSLATTDPLAADRQEVQARLAVEVLRRQLGSRPLADPEREASLVKGEAKYLREAYHAILASLGTSYEELRDVRFHGSEAKVQLATRLGIDDFARDGTWLDALFIEFPNVNYNACQVVEAQLLTTFGVQNTQFDPLIEFQPSGLSIWRKEHLRTLWKNMDFLCDQYSVVESTGERQRCWVDPDLIGPVDLRTHDDGNPAYLLWAKRREWVDDEWLSLSKAAHLVEAQLPDRECLDVLWECMYQPLLYNQQYMTVWLKNTNSPELLLDTREQWEPGQSIEGFENKLLENWGLSLDAFIQLSNWVHLILQKKQDMEQVLTVEEWQEILSILIQVRKVVVSHEWLNEENGAGLEFSWRYFQPAANEPAEGIWPPRLSQKEFDASRSATGYEGKYWSKYPFALPRWRASIEARAEWAQALRRRGQLPWIDPDVLITEDLKVDTAKQLLRERKHDMMLFEQKITDARLCSSNTWDQFQAVITASELGLKLDYLESALAKYKLGEAIDSWLAPWPLTLEAFVRFLRLLELAKSNQPILESEWQEVKSILVSIWKVFRAAQWQRIEETYGLFIGPDTCVIPTELNDTSMSAWQPIAWRSSWEMRQNAIDKLQQRVDQEKQALESLMQAVRRTETLTMPLLRSALVQALAGPSQTLEAAAKAFTGKWLIDFSSAGSITTTRLGQAIETMQAFLWALRTDQLEDTSPELELKAPDFTEEWKWIGTYTAWRSAMYMFLYPENLLLPTLRNEKTSAFRELVDTLRNSGTMSPQLACQAATDYSGYFQDVCQMDTRAVIRNEVRIFSKMPCIRKLNIVHLWDGLLFYASETGEADWYELKSGKTEIEYKGSYNYFGRDWDQILEAQYDGFSHRIVFYNSKTGKLAFYEFDKTFKVKYIKEYFGFKCNLQLMIGNFIDSRRADFYYGGDLFCYDPATGTAEVYDQQPTFGVLSSDARGEVEPVFVYSNLRANAKIIMYDNSVGFMLYDAGSGEVDLYKPGVTGGGLLADTSGRVQPLKRFSNWLKHADQVFVRDSKLYLYQSATGSVEQYLDDNNNNNWVMKQHLSWEPNATLIRGYYHPNFGTGVIFYFPIDGSARFYAWDSTGSKVLQAAVTDWSKAWNQIQETRYFFGQGTKTKSVYWSREKFTPAIPSVYAPWEKIPCLTAPVFLAGAALFKTVSGEKWIIVVATCQDANVPKLVSVRYNCQLNEWEKSSKDIPATLPNNYHVTLKPTTESEAPVVFVLDENQLMVGAFQLVNDAWKPSSIPYVGPMGWGTVEPFFAGPYDITVDWTEAELAAQKLRRETCLSQYHLDNKISPYLIEAWYSVPMEIALQLQKAGQYLAALDWYRTVYDYSKGEKDRGSIVKYLSPSFGVEGYLFRGTDWLQQALNPHAIAKTRYLPYRTYTLFSLVRCFLDYADAVFAEDTQESLPKARILYISALELLNETEFMKQWKADKSVVCSVKLEEHNFNFGVPGNPTRVMLALRAETNLWKLRNGRNLAGMARSVEAFPGSDDMTTNTPIVTPDGQIVLPEQSGMQPTPYRYKVLVERAKQLTQLASQFEGSMLSAFEKRDAEKYNLLRARQDLCLSQANVTLQNYRLNEAEGGEVLSDLQKNRVQFQTDHYNDLLRQPISKTEQAALNSLINAKNAARTIYDWRYASGVATVLSGVMGGVSAGNGVGGWIGAIVGGVLGLGTGGIQAYVGGLQTEISLNSLEAQLESQNAGYERRKQEWQFQRDLSGKDQLIVNQQAQIARDHTQVVVQEGQIAGIQAQNAEAAIQFLSNKFTNEELYAWMSGVLEGVYRFFLQQAASLARLAASQLAFERHETPPAYIQSNYWLVVSEGSQTTTNGSEDRHGLTGSARLLQDIYRLDQYAFESDKRKLQLNKIFSLARMAPSEFQLFRETGILVFNTPMQSFDHDFPGHYLRLIKRVRVSVVALIPPLHGIKASLTNSGLSRVVVYGDQFKTMVIWRDPEMVALTSPQNASGVFELEAQSEMLMPFESLGVDTTWEFQLPKAANAFDFKSIADVIISMDYTALNSYDYRQQVIQQLGTNITAERMLSLRDNEVDAWYELNNPETCAEPMTICFPIATTDFPPNLEQVQIKHLTLYFPGIPESITICVKHLKLLQGNSGIGGGGTATDRMLSTRQGNANTWLALIGKNPVGIWELALEDTSDMRSHFTSGKIEDILLVINYSAKLPAWPK